MRKEAQSNKSGLIAGSIIFTSKGEIPVEHLCAGDRIVTRDAGMAKLLDINVLRISAPTVTIKAGAFGDTRPDHNMIVPAAQRILLRDWRARSMFGKKQTTVQAGQLVDGKYISAIGTRNLRLVQLIFDKPHIIYADGLEVSIPIYPSYASVAA